MSKKLSSSYCPLAWNHSFINQDGSFQVCCTSEEFDNYIRGKNGTPLNISDGLTPGEVMNSDFMKNIRTQMMTGQWPKLCSRCKVTEDHGGASRRVLEIKNFGEERNLLNLSQTDSSGETSAPITSLDYRLGNLCNLQCRTCNPRSAQMWIKEWNEIKPEEEQFSDEVMESYKNYDWINSDALTTDFQKKAKNLTHIHFAGGEPLIVPQMRKVLEICIESGNAPNITITYNTNLTVLPDNIINLWKEFKTVKILASIDAIGDLNSYIRYPSTWSKIEDNLKKIETHHKIFNISECMLSATVQVLNIGNIPKMIRYLEQFDFIVPIPNLINLHVPHYFSSQVLPTKLKESIAQELLQIKAEKEGQVPVYFRYLTDNIEQIVNFMQAEDRSETFRDFLDFQRKFDLNKKLDVYKFYPHFKNFME